MQHRRPFGTTDQRPEQTNSSGFTHRNYAARPHAVLGNANREYAQEPRSDFRIGLSGRTETQVKRVLLVDDHDLFRQVLAVVLRWHTEFRDNYQAESLAEARQIMRDANGKIDMAIVDVDLPDGEGFKLIREICEGGTGVPVVAMTARQDRGWHARVLNLGASEVLTTRATGEQIIESVRRLEGD